LLGNAVTWVELRFRHTDPNNNYAVSLGADTGGGTGPVQVLKCVRGRISSLVGYTYYPAAMPVTVKNKASAANEATI